MDSNPTMLPYYKKTNIVTTTTFTRDVIKYSQHVKGRERGSSES